MGFGLSAFVSAASLALASAADAQAPRPVADQVRAADAELAGFVSPTLSHFSDETELRRYLGALRSMSRARRGRLGAAIDSTSEGVIRPQPGTLQPICPAIDPNCAEIDPDDFNFFFLAGIAHVFAPHRSVARDRAAGVDRGDVVRRLGDFLLVMQDSRIFVVDIRAGEGRPGLAVTDRVDLYRAPGGGGWYDQMLVFGDRVLVTAFSMSRDDPSTELSVFRLDAEGRLHSEGVFEIASNDLFHGSSYSARLVGDDLVIHTPLRAALLATGQSQMPVVRRLPGVGEGRAPPGRDRAWFAATDIYRPVSAEEDPVIHSVAVCPLGAIAAARNLACRVSAFVGPPKAAMLVTRTDAYLWTNGYNGGPPDTPACIEDRRLAAVETSPALIYRVPLDGAAPGVAAARGVPLGEDALQAGDGRLRALLNWRPATCRESISAPLRTAYFDMPLADIARRVAEVGDEHYTQLPGVQSSDVVFRFTDRHLVYGGARYEDRVPARIAPAYAVPLDRPREMRALKIGHDVRRADAVGGDIILAGRGGRPGVVVTLVRLEGQPRLSSLRLADRVDSSGLNDASDSRVQADGGLFAMPTLAWRPGESWAWHEIGADFRFIAFGRNGRLRPAGALDHRFAYGDHWAGETEIPGYRCKVFCRGWAGNSRPIFVGERIFALTGAELIEGEMREGMVREVQRINIALSPPPR